MRSREAWATHCSQCEGELSKEDHTDRHARDVIEIPPIKPFITRILQGFGICPHCKGRFTAPAPEGMEQHSPFGPNLVSLVVYLRTKHFVSYQRRA
jgi:transposase